MGTRNRSATSLFVGAVCAAAVGLAGCGSPETSSRNPQQAFPGDGCSPMANSQLVMLRDDKRMTLADNLVAAIHQAAAEPALVAALDRVAEGLDQPRIRTLNRATDLQRRNPQDVAREFESEWRLLGDGLERGSGRRIVIGATDVNENLTVAHLYRIALTGVGYDATVTTLGSRDTVEPALERGEIHVAPEYLGSLTEFLNRKLNGAQAAPLAGGDATATAAELRRLGAKVGLVFGAPAEATHQQGFAVSQALADRYHLRTLSQFAERCSGRDTVLGGPQDCRTRPWCQPGLERSYTLAVGRFVGLGGGEEVKAALRDGSVTIGLVETSDPALVS